MQDLRDKVAFITGGTTGIGLGIAKALRAAGMRLALTYRREEARREALAQLNDQTGTQVHAIELDVTDREGMKRAAEETIAVFGKVHILCNSAGVNLLGDMKHATHDDWDWIFDVNVKGIVNTLVSIVPLINAHGEGGHVVNVASMSSFIPGPASGVYATSKFAVRGLTESLRYSLAPSGIRVSMVCPGLTRTEIYLSSLKRPERFARTKAQVDDRHLKRMAQAHAAGMDPEEVGRRTLRGLLRDDFYIFTHSEFREELVNACKELISAFPDEPPGNAPRLAYEAIRKRTAVDARRVVDELTGSARR